MKAQSHIALALSIFLLGALPHGAQAQNLGAPQSRILILDSERVYVSSSTGQKVSIDLETRLDALSAENRRIETELEAEEQDLTEKRKTMDPVEFRALANAFDEKVQRLRAEQDAKQQELQRLREAERQSFIQAMTPIISQIAAEYGAVVILERRSVLLAADTIDITDQVIDRINASQAMDRPEDPPKDTTEQVDTPNE
ncbi:MAG: OmpH family outer membrane protein [Marinosulfonomonas sp.]